MGKAMIRNFRWLVKHRIAGSAVPRSADDIDWLRLQGIETVIGLSKASGEVLTRISELGMRYHQILIDDYGTPEYSDIDEFLSILDSELANGRRILLQSFDGTGRTGTMFALFLVHMGETWLNAVEQSGGLETGSQRLCVQMYQEQMKGELMHM